MQNSTQARRSHPTERPRRENARRDNDLQNRPGEKLVTVRPPTLCQNPAAAYSKAAENPAILPHLLPATISGSMQENLSSGRCFTCLFDQAVHRLRGFRTVTEPLVCLVEIDGIVTFLHRVVISNDLDESTIAPGTAVGGDNMIKGAILGTCPAKSECYGHLGCVGIN